MRGPCTVMKSGPRLLQLEKALAEKRSGTGEPAGATMLGYGYVNSPIGSAVLARL